MAEVLGLAASAAGLLSLAGQLLQGCLYLKDLFNDIKDAPADIQALSTEVEILSSAARHTAKIIEGTVKSGLVIAGAEYEPALQQCVGTVESLREFLAETSKKFSGDGGLKWWDRMKVASRKKALGSHISRLERAKTQVQMLQLNISLAVQNGERLSSIDTASLINDMSRRGEACMTLTELSNLEISTVSAKMNEMEGRLENLHDGVISLAAASHQQFSNTERMIDAAVSRALFKHRQVLTQLDSTTDTRDSVFWQFHDIRNMEGSKAKPLRQPIAIPSTSMRRSSRVIHWSYHRSILFNVKIKTIESSQTPSRRFSDLSVVESIKPPHRTTTIHVQSKIPIWKRGLVFEFAQPSTPSSASFGMQFRKYNIVSKDSPIFLAARRLDFAEMRRLFDVELASPYDRYDQHYISFEPRSILDEVLITFLPTRRISGDRLALPKEVDLAIEIASYLIEFMISDIHKSEWVWHAAHFLPWTNRNTSLEQKYTEVLRMILRSSCEDPLEGKSPHFWTQLSYDDHPISQLLRQQEYWKIDLEGHSEPKRPNAYVENDRQMLADPLGLQIEAALHQGQYYRPIKSWRAATQEFYGYQNSPFHTLLAICSASKRADVRECCKNRMIILLRNGLNPAQREWYYQDLCTPGLPVSPIEHARYLGIEEILLSALSLSGLSERAIQDLVDENYFAGLPQLIDGSISYKSQDECRREFMQNLCSGGYLTVSENELYGDFVKELNVITGFPISGCANPMISWANSAFLQKSTPGSWPNEEAIRLIPGLDFPLPWVRFGFYDRRPEQISKWTCVREMLGEAGVEENGIMYEKI